MLAGLSGAARAGVCLSWWAWLRRHARRRAGLLAGVARRSLEAVWPAALKVDRFRVGLW